MEEKRITDVRIGEYLTHDISLCVGNKSSIYINKFFKANDHGYSFNWCAALFAPCWFGYRKMWKGAGIIVGINLISSALMPFFDAMVMPQVTFESSKYYLSGSLGILLLTFAICGFAGDWAYNRHITKILDANQCKGRAAVADAALEERLRSAGGVSLGGLFAVWGIDFVTSNLVSSIMTTIAAQLL